MTNKYYQKHKETLQKEGCERYQNMSEEKREKREEKVRERYQNVSEVQNQKLLGYIRNRSLVHEK